VLTKNLTVFIKFWRFNAFFDEAFTVTSRSKTIAALRLCVIDGNAIGQGRGARVTQSKELDLLLFNYRPLVPV
jgi:hypothetical protein